MNLIHGIALVSFALGAIPASIDMAAAPMSMRDSASAQDAAQPGPAGTWKGSLLQRDWSFHFSLENGVWVGKYRTPDGKTWYPLTELVVKGRAVAFAIASKPKISFALDLDEKNAKLSGTATIDGLATVPFSAAPAP